MAALTHKYNPVAWEQYKKAISDLKALPPSNNVTELNARVEQIEKILGLR